MDQFLSYLKVLLAITATVLAYVYGGIWCASTFFLVGIIALTLELFQDRLSFTKEAETPRWICGTPFIIAETVAKHYRKAEELLTEAEEITTDSLKEKLDVAEDIADAIIDKMVSEGIVTKKIIYIRTPKK